MNKLSILKYLSYWKLGKIKIEIKSPNCIDINDDDCILYIYKVVISVLYGCMSGPLGRFASNFDCGTREKYGNV